MQKWPNGPGIDAIGYDPNTNTVWAAESKGTGLGRPPSLKTAQANMDRFVRSRLADAIKDDSGYPPAATPFKVIPRGIL